MCHHFEIKQYEMDEFCGFFRNPFPAFLMRILAVPHSEVAYFRGGKDHINDLS